MADAAASGQARPQDPLDATRADREAQAARWNGDGAGPDARPGRRRSAPSRTQPSSGRSTCRATPRVRPRWSRGAGSPRRGRARERRRPRRRPEPPRRRVLRAGGERPRARRRVSRAPPGGGASWRAQRKRAPGKPPLLALKVAADRRRPSRRRTWPRRRRARPWEMEASPRTRCRIPRAWVRRRCRERVAPVGLSDVAPACAAPSRADSWSRQARPGSVARAGVAPRWRTGCRTEATCSSRDGAPEPPRPASRAAAAATTGDASARARTTVPRIVTARARCMPGTSSRGKRLVVPPMTNDEQDRTAVQGESNLEPGCR